MTSKLLLHHFLTVCTILHNPELPLKQRIDGDLTEVKKMLQIEAKTIPIRLQFRQEGYTRAARSTSPPASAVPPAYRVAHSTSPPAPAVTPAYTVAPQRIVEGRRLIKPIVEDINRTKNPICRSTARTAYAHCHGLACCP